MSYSAHVLQARRNWINLYQETGDAGLVCRRCGISRPTLRKWWRRFQQHGEQGYSQTADDLTAPPTAKSPHNMRS
jgi:transposase-like protein